MTIARTIPAHAMTAMAGWIDTVGILLFFQELRVFPAYMSGNTTRLFVSTFQGEPGRALLYAGAILLFVAGAVLGRCINDGTRGREAAALQLEAGLLCTAALAASRSAPELLTLGLLTFAMGWNNVALRARSGIGPRGYITGTLVSFASNVADALMRRGAWRSAIEPAVIWASLATGALAGAYSTAYLSAALVLLVPASVAMLCGFGVLAGWLHVDAKTP